LQKFSPSKLGLRLATALPVLKNHLRTTAHINARNHKWIQCEHRCFTVYGTQVFRVVSVLLSVWKRKSVLVETNGRCKNIFLSSQHRGTNMIRCQGFLKLGTGHSVKHRCLNALSPSLAPAKAHIVASLTLMTVFSLHFFSLIIYKEIYTGTVREKD